MKQAAALFASGRLKDAERLFTSVIKIDHKHLPAHMNRAKAHLALGRPDAANADLDIVLTHAPELAQAMVLKAQALWAMGRTNDVETWMRRAISLSPNDCNFRILLAELLLKNDRMGDARKELLQCIDIAPENSEALALLAQIQHSEADYAGAEINLKKAISIAGDSPDLLNNLAIAIKRQDRPEDAVHIYERALRVSPNNTEILCNLGSANIAIGNVDVAEKLFRDALQLAPDHSKAIHNLGLLLLNHEEFIEGWQLYSRSVEQALSDRNPYSSAAPLWRGEPLDDSRLLIWRNQGVGDELIYSGMLPELIDRGAKISYKTDSRMAPLLQRSFPSVQVSVLDSVEMNLSPEQNFDFQGPIHLLGAQLRRSPDDFPRHTGYIKADAARTNQLRTKYSQNGKPVVGISWRSKAPYSGSIKSSDLAAWRPVLMQEDITFVNLQYGGFTEDIDRVQNQLGIQIINDPDIDAVADIDGCAAQVASMDLVISTSSTTVHMAGALGIPVWTLLPHHGLSLWYWFDNRDDCPWYPSMKLFRQQRQGDWHGLLQQVGTELTSLINTR